MLNGVFVHWVNSIKGSPWAPLVFVSVYAVSCLIAPVTPFSIAGGVLFGFWRGLLFNLLSSNLGAFMAFAIARVLGREAVQKILRGRAKALDEGFKRNGFWGVLVVRLVGVPPFILANYIAGLSGVGVRDYILATFLGSVPWTIGITYFSDILWQKFVLLGMRGVQESLASHLGPLGLAAGTLGALLALGVYVWRKWRAQVAS